MPEKNEVVSAGHKLGQLIGDWFEHYFVLPLLLRVSEDLSLYLHNRFLASPERPIRTDWKDENGNIVDYDFVLELSESLVQKGAPVGFIESCWRRGSRHSKDKVRDDSGKLLPMRSSYPTARFLGMIVAGSFTEPSRDFVRSRSIDLFYVPKDKIIDSFSINHLIVDYADTLTEQEKRQIALDFESAFNDQLAQDVANTLVSLIGVAAVNSYVNRVHAALSALPQEIRIILRNEFPPVVFENAKEVSSFLKKPLFPQTSSSDSYVYQITYNDGTEFEQVVTSLEELKSINNLTTMLTDHVNKLALDS